MVESRPSALCVNEIAASCVWEHSHHIYCARSAQACACTASGRNSLHRMASRQYHEVLRQIDIATVLPHGVEFLREAKGPCESTYDLSEPMMLGTDYDDFVSHTWRPTQG